MDKKEIIKFSIFLLIASIIISLIFIFVVPNFKQIILNTPILKNFVEEKRDISKDEIKKLKKKNVDVLNKQFTSEELISSLDKRAKLLSSQEIFEEEKLKKDKVITINSPSKKNKEAIYNHFVNYFNLNLSINKDFYNDTKKEDLLRIFLYSEYYLHYDFNKEKYANEEFTEYIIANNKLSLGILTEISDEDYEKYINIFSNYKNVAPTKNNNNDEIEKSFKDEKKNKKAVEEISNLESLTDNLKDINKEIKENTSK